METTGEASGVASTSAGAQVTAVDERYGGIDPDLAYLDPSLAHLAGGPGKSGGPQAQQARFNARKGRFQANLASLTPDHISDFKRSERQQEAFYDTALWQASLGGKGIKGDGASKKRVTAKEVVSDPLVLAD